MTGTGAPPPGKLRDFHHELEQLLLKQLEQQPDLHDVRVKLIELYYAQRHRDKFLAAAKAFRRRLRNPEAVREWSRVASMGRMLLPGEELFAGYGEGMVEFIAEAPVEGPLRIRRFGDEDRHRTLFEGLAEQYEALRSDAGFFAEYEQLLVGLATRRPTPLIHARRLSEHVGGAQIHIKREDLAGEHPHLTVSVTGQALVGRRLGRKTLVTGTVDGRRGVVTAALAARMGMGARIYMDVTEAQRQSANVLYMKLMGAELMLVKAADYRNDDVREAALENSFKAPEEFFLIMGLDAAPAPYPIMTQEFTAAIGRECRRQFAGAGRKLPELIVARGGTSADALGLYPAFLADRYTRLVCVEPEKGAEAGAAEVEDPFTQLGMPMSTAERKVARGILDRLEYPSVAREHALLKATGRVEYVRASREAAKRALFDLARLEGLVPAIETAHALAWACDAARALRPQHSVIVLMAEDAQKDVWDIRRLIDAP